MRKVFSIVCALLVALTLATVLAVPAMAVTQDVGATVTVSQTISATITDVGGGGLIFGSLLAGTDDEPEAAQDADNGAVTIVVAAETNEDCDIKVKATDFSDGGTNTLAITNATYNTTNDTGTDTAFAAAGNYYTLDTSTAGTAKTVEVYHWLSIPDGQAAAAYTSTFTYAVE